MTNLFLSRLNLFYRIALWPQDESISMIYDLIIEAAAHMPGSIQ